MGRKVRGDFAYPQKLIDRAKRALDAAHEILEAFFTDENLRTVIEEDPKTSAKVKKIRMVGELPDLVEEHATNALNNLRNAFDQMLFAACEGIGKPLPDGHYPWADTPTQLETRKFVDKSGKEKIPPELWDLIRRQEPYPANDGYAGGDTLMRAVSILANDKHTCGLIVRAKVTRIDYSSLTISGGFVAVPMEPRWDPCRNEIELRRWWGSEPEPHTQDRIEFNVGFDEGAPAALRDVPALDALRGFANYAQNCLDGFKARVAELIS